MVALLPHRRLVGARRAAPCVAAPPRAALARRAREAVRAAHTAAVCVDACPRARLPSPCCACARAPSIAQGLYLFAYSIMYFYTQLELTSPVATIIYFGYMAIAALVFFLVTGTVGFYSSWQFVWTIYAAVKVD